jgi:hypothetical protein
MNGDVMEALPSSSAQYRVQRLELDRSQEIESESSMRTLYLNGISAQAFFPEVDYVLVLIYALSLPETLNLNEFLMQVGDFVYLSGAASSKETGKSFPVVAMISSTGSGAIFDYEGWKGRHLEVFGRSL